MLAFLVLLLFALFGLLDLLGFLCLPLPLALLELFCRVPLPVLQERQPEGRQAAVLKKLETDPWRRKATRIKKKELDDVSIGVTYSNQDSKTQMWFTDARDAQKAIQCGLGFGFEAQHHVGTSRQQEASFDQLDFDSRWEKHP